MLYRKTKNQRIGGRQEASRRSRSLMFLLAAILMLTLTGCAALGPTPTGSTSTGRSSAAPTAAPTTASTTSGETTDDGTTTTGTTATGTTSLGKTERNFTLTDVKGATFTLDQTVGKKVYIKFWAT